ncbi:DUF4214 domain-containing protein [Nguyenibacter vanlangensis]|uniref:DUF4214 domain-containing protein n=1 Tax=Nguyenibacter vanlangensis TaxID=1216886 RepID=A0A7Y7M5G1_9PROT|nr:DUF4214 domain-containing protein [Nguyenibacter vanlangensis]NVN09834.1 DUF4214 domain-containing protein [Nguyenibacter vanlangensis]
MSKQHAEICFVAFEEKDLMSLLPIYNSVRIHRPDARLFTIGFDRGYADSALSFLFGATFPIIIAASPGSVTNWLEIIRPRWSYHLIGIEHGVSPFKKFTYSDAFLCYDDYFAPSILWKERLERLYPSRSTRFHLGGYPKANQFICLVPDEARKDILPPIPYDVVVFSWGLKEEALFSLPDRDNVIYLLHPAQVEFSRPYPFKRSRVIISSLENTTSILSNADRVFGDISSMTFEISQSKKTYLIIDRSLYIEDYDIDDSIMDPASDRFAYVPETDFKIDSTFILDKALLIAALHGDPLINTRPLNDNFLIETIICPMQEDLCTKGILSIAEGRERIMAEEKAPHHQEAAIEFIQHAYRLILGREPDLDGLRHYLTKLNTSSSSALSGGLEILLELAQSDEAMQRPVTFRDAWPKLMIGTDPRYETR